MLFDDLNMVVSSANTIVLVLVNNLCKSLVYIIKRSGPITDPWGTPYVIVSVADFFVIDLNVLFSISKVASEPLQGYTPDPIMGQFC